MNESICRPATHALSACREYRPKLRARPQLALLVWALPLLAAGCRDNLTDPSEAKGAELRILGGDGQQSEPGMLLNDSLAVQVVDRDGAGVAGTRVDFVVLSGGGSAAPVQGTTNDAGIARTAWTLGTGEGEQRLEARSSGLTGVSFRARAVAREPPAGLEVVTGDGQVGYAAATLPDSLAVRVMDRHGHVVRDAAVHFSVESGGGSVSLVVAASDSAGVARVRWDLGTVAGEQRASARLANGVGQAVVFRAQALEDLRIAKTGVPLVDDLVGRLQSAADDAARARAVLFMAQAIGVGVYTKKGEPVVIGAERAPLDFYLYDFQVPIIARAQGRAQYWSLLEMAELLASMEIRPGDEPLPPQMLLEALTAAAEQALAQPTHPHSLLPLLLRELGLRQAQSYDLAAAPPMDAVRFDALQNWLLLVALGRPFVNESPPSASGSSLAQLSGGIVRHAPHGSAQPAPASAAAVLAAGAAADLSWCARIGSRVPETGPVNNWVLDRLLDKMGKTGKTIARTVRLSGVVLDGLHGMILAYGVKVTTPDEWLKTHYGHDTDGAELRFRVKVEMLDDLGPALVECGWIASIEFPPSGPIAGVTVSWSEAEGELRAHGTLVCGTPCITPTGADGIATLVFRPRREVIAGRGSCPGGGAFACTEESGIMSGTALYQSKFGNYVIGGAAQFLTPKYGSTRWTVEYHRLPRELEILFQTQVTLKDEPGDGVYRGSMRSTFRMVLREGNTTNPSDPQQRYVGEGGFTYEFTFTPAPGTCGPVLRGHRVAWMTRAGMPIRAGQPLELYFTPGTWMETWTARVMNETGHCVNEETAEHLGYLIIQWIDHHEHELFTGAFFRLDEYQYSFRLRNFSGALQDGLIAKEYNFADEYSTERTRIEIRVVTP
jgi:hypothetical protein